MTQLDKHLKYVNQKALARRQSLLFRSLMLIGLVFMAVSVYGAVIEPHNALENILVTSGTGSLAMCAMVSINDVADRDTSGNAIGYKVWLIPVSDIDDSVPFPTVNVNREVSSIPMKSGKYMHYFEAHVIPTFISNGTKEANAVTITGTNTFTVIMGGNRAELLNFIENYAGTKFVVIFKECESNIMQGIGNPCKPVVLSTYENKNDADSRSVTFTFTQTTIQQPWTYIGGIVTQDPVTVPAGTTTLPIVAGNNRYILPNGTSATYAVDAVSGITAADVGRVIALIGDGTTNAATVADGDPFLLVDGATWTASKGKELHLKVFDANTLIEVNRI